MGFNLIRFFEVILNNVYSVTTMAAVLCLAREAERDSDLRHRLRWIEAAASYIRR